MFLRWGFVCTLVAFLFSMLSRAGDKPFEKTAPVANVNNLEKLLLSGKYRDIPLGNDAASKAIWALGAYCSLATISRPPASKTSTCPGPMVPSACTFH